jgi:hypothetical protein
MFRMLVEHLQRGLAMDWIDQRVAELGFWRIREDEWVPPTEADFALLAQRLGGNAPSDYQKFIRAYGDCMLGTDDWTVKAPISEPCPWGTQVGPEQFFPVGDDEESVGAQLDTYASRLPRGVAPIASDAGGNLVCLDVAGRFPETVWFWDHEQRWFKGNLQDAADELTAAGKNTRTMSVHDIIRDWARLHASELDRPADYMGMYRMAPSFADFLRSLQQVPY